MNLAQTNRTLSDMLVARLAAMGVRAVFGIPGGAAQPLYDAIARAERDGRIRHILVRHESNAANMAYGWWQETGTPAAIVTTTGPGAINALAGAAAANVDRVPMIVLTSQVSGPKKGRNAVQESSDASRMNTVAMFSDCTKYSVAISHPAQLEQLLAMAYVRMFEGLPGPVHLSIPTDLQRAPATPHLITAPMYGALLRRDRVLPNEDMIALATYELRKATRPAVLLGDGSRSVVDLAFSLAEKIGAPVCASPLVNDLVRPSHPLFRGYLGFGGHSAASQTIADSDCVLLISSSGGELEAATWGDHVKKTVHLSDAPEKLAQTPDACCLVLSDLEVAMQRLLDHPFPGLPPVPFQPWKPALPPLQPDQGVPPQWLMDALARKLPAGTAIYADAGNSLAWMIHCLHGVEPTGPFRLSMHYASMGWAIGASVGAALAKKRPVAAIIGDGAMLMSGQEFSAAVHEGTPVVFVVLNDAALGMVRHGQAIGNVESVGWKLPATDFAVMATAMGGAGVSIRTVDELEGLDFAAMFARNGPTLVDVHIDREQVPPIADRISGLKDVMFGEHKEKP